MYDWRISVNQNMAMLTYDIFIYRQLPDNKREFKLHDSVLTTNSDMMKSDDLVFARIDMDLAQELVNILSEKGFKTNNDHKIEGLLEATKYHLEDMRKLLKLKER